jgi:hypothetical protein
MHLETSYSSNEPYGGVSDKHLPPGLPSHVVRLLEHIGALLHIPPRHGGADWLARLLPRHVPAGVAMVALVARHICPTTSIYEAVVANVLS